MRTRLSSQGKGKVTWGGGCGGRARVVPWSRTRPCTRPVPGPRQEARDQGPGGATDFPIYDRKGEWDSVPPLHVAVEEAEAEDSHRHLGPVQKRPSGQGHSQHGHVIRF